MTPFDPVIRKLMASDIAQLAPLGGSACVAKTTRVLDMLVASGAITSWFDLCVEGPVEDLILRVIVSVHPDQFVIKARVTELSREMFEVSEVMDS